MKKWIFIILTIFSLGIFYLLPTCKCASYNETSQLDSINRLSNIIYNSNSDSYVFYIDNTDYTYSTKRYTIQCFNKSTPNTPYSINNFNGTISVFLTNNINDTSGQAMTSYTSNNNYAYYYSTMTTYNYIVIRSSYGQSINLSDYCFNITINPSATYIGSFVPNTYYNLNNNNYNGFFNNWSIYGLIEGQNTKYDYNSDCLFYNTIKLGSQLDSFVRTNNTNSYQQSLYIECDNFIVGNSPQVYMRYCEITNININGTDYSYNDARQLFSWLGSNITLYNDNSSLFNFTLGDKINDVIYSMNIRVADYTFKQSSYYNSSIGMRGYLENFYISTLSVSDNTAYTNGYNFGYDAGLSQGYNNGYNDAVASNTGGFDNLMFAVADVPIHIISSVLNFNILGVNLLSFFMAIITLMLFIFIIRKFKE